MGKVDAQGDALLHSTSGSSIPPIDAARVLQQALADLDLVKRQIKQPFMAKASVEATLSRLEGDLRAKAQVLMDSSASPKPPSATALGSTLSFRPKTRPLPPVQPSAAERVALYKADFVSRPQTEAARQYIQERYGVPAPTNSSSSSASQDGLSSTQKGYGPGSVTCGISASASPSVIMPRGLRHDPLASVPAELADMEMHRGLMHLQQRGLLHSKADLTLALVGNAPGFGATGASAAAPVQAGSAPLHTFQNQFTRPPPTNALEDSLIAASSTPYKLDLFTPVVRKEPAAMATEKRQPGSKHLPDGAFQINDDRMAPGGSTSRSTPPQENGTGVKNGSDPARPFHVLMDTFSLHEFMIRNGRTITETPEYESYRRSHEPMWEVIDLLISQLEAIMIKYAVPLAIVDGKSLAELAQGNSETERQPGMQDLLLCIKNIQEVGEMLRQPGRRFLGGDGKAGAATAIQAAWKGMIARRRHSKAGVAAAAIQGAWRTHRLRQQLTQRLVQARQTRNEHFHRLQQRLQEQWPLLQRNTHVVIHVPSIHRKQSMTMAQSDALLDMEASQLARLCDLAEPLVEVVLLLPGPPDHDVLSYWDKILQVGGVDEPGSRYRIIWPENHSRLPSHMNVAAKILSSPAAMKRLRGAVSGRMAYILPGMVGDEEVDLCVQLNVPILGPSPGTFTALSRKSGGRAILADAGVIVPPGVNIAPRHLIGSSEEDMTIRASGGMPSNRPSVGCADFVETEGQNVLVSPLKAGTEFSISPDGEVTIIEPKPVPPLISKTQRQDDETRVFMLIAEAMVRSPWISRWVVKIDDESLGTGSASLDLRSIKGASDVLQRSVREHHHLMGSGPHSESSSTRPPGGLLSEPQRVAQYRLNELLHRQLPRELKLACPEVYPTYRDFISAVGIRGGVVEASPDQVLGSPCANIFVTPNGDTTLISTHERIFVAPHRAIGSTFPQHSVPHAALAEAVLSIGLACYRAGLIGHACVDFVAARDQSGALRLWAVGLCPMVTPSLLSFQLFDFLSVGIWDPINGRYTVQVDHQIKAEDVQDLNSAVSAVSSQSDWEGVPLGSRLDDDQASRHSSSCISSVYNEDPLGSEPGSPQHLDKRGSGGGARAKGGSSRNDYSSSGHTRHFFSLESAVHAGVSAAPCSKLFHRAWQEGLHFDVDHRTGVVFNLSDRYIAGIIGILTVGSTPSDMYSSMQRVLTFVGQRQHEASEAAIGHTSTAHRGGAANNSVLSSGRELAPYKDIQLLVKFMAEKSAEISLSTSSQHHQQQSTATGLPATLPPSWGPATAAPSGTGVWVSKGTAAVGSPPAGSGNKSPASPGIRTSLKSPISPTRMAPPRSNR